MLGRLIISFTIYKRIFVMLSRVFARFQIIFNLTSKSNRFYEAHEIP